MGYMKRILLAAALSLCSTMLMAETAQERLTTATNVFHEIMATPDKGIPQDLLEKANCAIIIPDLKKAAFVVGGQYGRGFAVCRKASGTGWGAPMAVRMEGGSVGFQLGAESTDLVMLVMNKAGMDKLMEDKFALGADASVAAGPVGRMASANTNARMDAQILAWSRSKGLFAGVSLSGATLRNDLDENAELYGRKITNREVTDSGIKAPASAQGLITELNRYSMRETNADRTVKER
jgi:SH3 domain-containing YSC84-like protein 1